LRSGISVGAIAEHEETKNDFNIKWELNPTKLFIGSELLKKPVMRPKNNLKVITEGVKPKYIILGFKSRSVSDL